jgi:hypothetical protein
MPSPADDNNQLSDKDWYNHQIAIALSQADNGETVDGQTSYQRSKEKLTT